MLLKAETIAKKGSLAAMLGLAMVVGIVGGNLLQVNQTHAQTANPTPAATSTQTAPSQTNQNIGTGARTFKSNEDPTHEAKESAAWEAQENAGQAPWQAAK